MFYSIKWLHDIMFQCLLFYSSLLLYLQNENSEKEYPGLNCILFTQYYHKSTSSFDVKIENRDYTLYAWKSTYLSAIHY